VELIDPSSILPCAFSEMCGVPSMTFQGVLIAPRPCVIAMTTVKKGATRLPFPNFVMV